MRRRVIAVVDRDGDAEKARDDGHASMYRDACWCITPRAKPRASPTRASASRSQSQFARRLQRSLASAIEGPGTTSTYEADPGTSEARGPAAKQAAYRWQRRASAAGEHYRSGSGAVAYLKFARNCFVRAQPALRAASVPLCVPPKCITNCGVRDSVMPGPNPMSRWLASSN